MGVIRCAARVATVTVAAAVFGCGDGSGQRVVGSESGAIDIKVPRPSFTLTDTDGNPFDFAARTAGRLTILEFGYVNCPDVCPIHMANLAAVMRNLPASERLAIDVVFVSVDPDRDSLPALKRWLAAFDGSFIGLTGSRAALDAAQLAVNFGPATVSPGPDGVPVVTHAAPVLVFTADDTAHVMYPFGTRQADWARDLPRLLQKKASKAARATAPAPAPVTVERAYIVEPAGNAPAAIYAVIRNTGGDADTLIALDGGTTGPVSIHESVHDAAAHSVTMRFVPQVAVPARGSARFAPGGLHGMLTPTGPALRPGDEATLVFRFARAGSVIVRARVIARADVDSATAARNP